MTCSEQLWRNGKVFSVWSWNIRYIDGEDMGTQGRELHIDIPVAGQPCHC